MTSVEPIRNRVLELISKHDPDKVVDVNILMKKWKGKENVLLKTLCEKYNEKFKRIRPVTIKQKYSIGPKINCRSIGDHITVRKCKRRADGKVFAIKIINKKDLKDEDRVMIDDEIEALRQISGADSHPNITKLYDVFDGRTKTGLVLDDYDGGDLWDKLTEDVNFRHLHNLSEAHAADIFRQYMSALAYLHKKGIAWRYGQPDNITFLSKDRYEEYYSFTVRCLSRSPIKLVNFELAATDVDGRTLRTPCGHPNYVAPEILRSNREPYGIECDLWSAGVVLYILLCGLPPFFDEDDNLGRLYRKIKRVDYNMPSLWWAKISIDAKDLVRKLLEVDVQKRLTAQQVLRHPWCQIERHMFADLNIIDARTKKLVFAFCTMSSQEVATQYLPPLVVNLCTLFYGIV